MRIVKNGKGGSTLNRAQQDNQNAAAFLREFAGASFGPKGLDKLSFTTYGDVFALQDCRTILEKADFKHPLAKIMLDLAKFLNAKWGDGSSTAVLLATGLIEKGFHLIERGISPANVIDGYTIAKEESVRFLRNRSHDNLDAHAIYNLIRSFLSSKLPADECMIMTGAIYSATSMVMVQNKPYFDPETIKITAKEGATISQTKVLAGIAFDSEVLHRSMPTSIANARIAIIEELLDIRKTRFDSEFRIDSPETMGSLKKREKQFVDDLVSPIISSGANVLLTHKGISEFAQAKLASAGILAARRIGLVDLRRISKATGAKIVNSTAELSGDSLGFAPLVEQRYLAGTKWLFIEGCKNPKAVSLIIRAGSQRAANALEDLSIRAIRLLEATLKNPGTIVGGGAPEFAIYDHLRTYALKFSGREQLAIEAFAEVMFSIVETLARNCGMKQLDTRTQLLSLKGFAWIDSASRSVKLYGEEAPIEPLGMKIDIMAPATEVATTILRIGDTYNARVHPRKEREPDYP